MSYFWVLENNFFTAYSVINWFYFWEPTNQFMRKYYLDYFFIFGAYWVREILFPRTSMRFSQKNTSLKKKENVEWHDSTTTYLRIIYLWIKHPLYLFLLYMKLLDRITVNDQYYIYLIYLPEGFFLTVSFFTHTLRFKGYTENNIGYMLFNLFCNFYFKKRYC
jgi:hypothetical protein